MHALSMRTFVNIGPWNLNRF